MNTFLLSLSFALVACDGGEVELDDTGTEADADADSDTDTDTDADADADSDADSDPITDTLGFDVSGENVDGLTVGVVRLNEDFTPGDTLAAGVVASGRAEITVENPDSESLFEIQEGYDTVGAFYATTLWDDTNSDGEHQEGEAIHGIGDALVIYLEGVEGELAFIVQDGWQGLQDQGEGLPLIFDKGELPIAANLAPITVEIGGTATLPKAETPWRMAMMPGAFFESEASLTPIYDEVLGAEWSVTLQDAPPADHEGPDGFLELGVAMPDTDGSGSLTRGDDLSQLMTMCSVNGNVVAAAWLAPARSVEEANYYSGVGFRGGWNMIEVYGEEDVRPVSVDQYLNLAFDGSCGFE